ncbi:Ig-like domain-containing protein [Nocardioides sp. AE5]|uniref:Ig-like domain-containing protein n=1 Tax=Nocardioides sp. AE5 TaxID=2962573 RepID=UPI002881A2B2|nr:Ig-like domain-containing protein [Nocardioides sp. AE5]MDT0203425.1 Ig-like domain-containing protein [Nocardioides sp. AE5]
MSKKSIRRPRAWRKPLAITASVGLTAAGLGIVAAGSAAAAPSVTITVDSLAYGANALSYSANPSECRDKQSPATCSLSAAIAYANAIPAGSGEIAIVFDDSLSGTIVDPGGSAGKMSTANGSNNLTGGYSATSYVINASNPVTIDFGGDIGFASELTDWGSNGFDIQSDNVTLTNFTNIASPETAIVIRDVDGTTISNGACNQIKDSGGNNTIWLEACIVIDPGTSGGVTTNTTITNMAFEDPWTTAIGVDFDGLVDGLTVTNSSMVNDRNAPNFLQLGRDSLTENAVLSGISVTVPDGKSVAGYAIYPRARANMNSFTVTDSTFTGMRGAFIPEPGAQEWNDITITNSTFNKVGQIWDDGPGPVNNLTFTNNLVTNGTENGPYLRGALNMDQATYTNTVISNNTFKDNNWRGSGDIYYQQVGANNVIANNTWSRTQAGDDGYQNAIRDWVSAPSATDSTGWTIQYNHIEDYGHAANAYAPIWIRNRGITTVVGNTFGPNTRGTIDPVQSEGGSFWFVSNEDSGTNNNIQTWRPANAVFDGSNVTFDVAPVDPAVGGNAHNQPTAPVSLGVFWTADDNAEVYLGQIDNVSPGSVSIPTTATGGFIRVQTIQADGTTSQYSGLAQVTTTLAAPVITGPTGGSSGDGATEIAGTGGPGNTITVTDKNDGSTVCTTTVAADGTWSCTPDTLLTQGVHALVATQSDGTNTSPESNQVNFTSDGTPLFASPEVALAASAVLGLGSIGGLLLMRRRRQTA